MPMPYSTPNNKTGLPGVWKCGRHSYAFDLQHRNARHRIKGFATAQLAAMARDRVIKAFDLPHAKAFP